ncbi:MAG: hypothetical protein R3E67_05425 [Pseudomonadales bacterium]
MLSEDMLTDGDSELKGRNEPTAGSGGIYWICNTSTSVTDESGAIFFGATWCTGSAGV